LCRKGGDVCHEEVANGSFAQISHSYIRGNNFSGHLQHKQHFQTRTRHARGMTRTTLFPKRPQNGRTAYLHRRKYVQVSTVSVLCCLYELPRNTGRDAAVLRNVLANQGTNGATLDARMFTSIRTCAAPCSDGCESSDSKSPVSG
jgi:hypothetical protein